ncbi:Cupin [uncultured Gammaproteobacteria bacterium]
MADTTISVPVRNQPADIITLLGMQPHPEGGYFVETFRDHAINGGRGACTAIYYLLSAGQRSHWHRVDAVEIWHWYAGAALGLSTAAAAGQPVATVILGPDLAAGQRPQAVVPAGDWQSSEPLGPWTLVGCTVAPAFQFSGFEMAPPGWAP